MREIALEKRERYRVRLDKSKLVVSINNRNIGDVYKMGLKIGGGGYGKVYLGTNRETKVERAIKRISKKNV